LHPSTRAPSGVGVSLLPTYTAAPAIYTLSLHDALPISLVSAAPPFGAPRRSSAGLDHRRLALVLAVLEKRAHLGISTQDVFVNIDRKSTRLNSSHVKISYAVFCLKKKTEERTALMPINT